MRARVDFRNGEAWQAASGLSPVAVPRPHDDLVARLLRWTLLLLPLNWICGTTPFWCYGVALLLLFRAETFSLLEGLFVWLIAALILGVVVGVMRGAPLDRALASIYNLTIIVVLIAFLNGGASLYRADEDERRGRLFVAAFWLFGLNAAFVLLVFVATKATGNYDVAVRTLILGLAGHLPGVFGEYGQVDIAVTDWTVGGPETRVIGFGIYATEGALIFLLLGLLGEVAAFAKRNYARVVAIEVAIAVGLVIMASRTTLGAYLFSLALLAVMQRRRLATVALVLAPAALIGALVVATYGADAIAQWFAARNEARLGSSDTRFLSYSTAIAMVMAQNPLTGLGIKPVDHALMEIPIGSHSTIASTFAKGGFVALGVLGAIFLTLIGGIVRAQAVVWVGTLRGLPRTRQFELIQLSRCVLVTLIWWTTEDFDAPAHEAVLAGLCFGLFWGATRRFAQAS